MLLLLRFRVVSDCLLESGLMEFTGHHVNGVAVNEQPGAHQSSVFNQPAKGRHKSKRKKIFSFHNYLFGFLF